MDSKAFNRLITEIYEAPFAGRYSQGLLTLMAEHLGSSVAAVLEEASDSGRARVLEKVGLTDRAIQEYERYYAKRSVLLRESARYSRVGQVFCDHMIDDYDEYTRSEAYHEFFRPTATEHLMQVHIERTRDWITAIAFRRPKSVGPFAAADRRKLDRLIPHLINSARHVRLLRDQAILRRSIVDALDRLKIPAFLLTDENRVLFTNSSGESLLAEGDVLCVRGGRLVTGKSDELTRLQTMLSDTRKASDSGSQSMRDCLASAGKTGRNPVMLYAMPVPRDVAEQSGANPASVMLVAVGVSATPSGSRLLRQLYGLTQTEAQIVGSLCNGLSVREIAEQRKTSTDAVRFHLKNVFQKLNIHRQSELVKLVCSGPAGSFKRRGS